MFGGGWKFLLLMLAVCLSGGCQPSDHSASEIDTTTATSTTASSTTQADQQDTDTTQVETTQPDQTPEAVADFNTLEPGSALPDSQHCAEVVRSLDLGAEIIDANKDENQTTVEIDLDVDGASEETNARFAPRVKGDFTGTTEEILLWGACKWGFDDDITKARAVAESSWEMATIGDKTDSEDECEIIGLDAPCGQSYGLLQVKGTVHLGTFPHSQNATALGVDYAMAWLRSCFEGSFTWLDEQGYTTGDEWGCVGAWFSGNWYDNSAKGYIAVVQGHLDDRTWENYEDN